MKRTLQEFAGVRKCNWIGGTGLAIFGEGMDL